MPLSPPAPRTLKHVRRVNYQGFERDDGLWDIEGELHDSKAYDASVHRGEGVRRAGEPIHHMLLRVTVDRQLVVQAIDVAMDAHPLKDCPLAQAALLGGHVRVGLEDSLWLGRGKLAESNAAQVTQVRQIIEGLGLEIATPAEAREILQLKGADKVQF